MLGTVRRLLLQLTGQAAPAVPDDGADPSPVSAAPNAPPAANYRSNGHTMTPSVTGRALPPQEDALTQVHHLLVTGKTDRALSLLEAHLRTQPSEELAVALEEVRTIRRARKRLQRHPSDPRTHLELGRALFAQGCGAEALEHLETTCRLRPGWLEPHLLRAIELHYQERWREAEAAYQHVLVMEPAHPLALHCLTAARLRYPPDDRSLPASLLSTSSPTSMTW